MVEWRGSGHGCLRATSTMVMPGYQLKSQCHSGQSGVHDQSHGLKHVDVHDLCCCKLIWARKFFVVVAVCLFFAVVSMTENHK